MSMRIRYYTYKVTSIDLADYYADKDAKLPLFIDYVPVKRNAAEARLEISTKTTRNLVFLSTVRCPQRKTSSISSVKVTRLTKRQVLTVDRAIAERLTPASLGDTVTSTVKASSSTLAMPSGFYTSFTAPASTVADTVTVSTTGSTNMTAPLNLVIVPPGPVTEAPVDPQQDKMTERAKEDDRSVPPLITLIKLDLDNDTPEICSTCGQEQNAEIMGEYPCPECLMPQLHDEPAVVFSSFAKPKRRLSRWVVFGIPAAIILVGAIIGGLLAWK